MSATWLLLPFLAGLTRERAAPAAALGLLVTYAGLLGYFVMTLSPLEGVALSQVHLAAFLRSQSDLLVGGLLSGPLFGWLGQRWRVSRSWASALLIAGAVCGEPLARALVGRLEARHPRVGNRGRARRRWRRLLHDRRRGPPPAARLPF